MLVFWETNHAATKCGVSKHLKHDSISSVLKLYLCAKYTNAIARATSGASVFQTHYFIIGTTYQRNDVRDIQRDLFQNGCISVMPAVARVRVGVFGTLQCSKYHLYTLV